MKSDTFNISWNDFEASAENSYKELLTEGNCSDVTLDSDDHPHLLQYCHSDQLVCHTI